MGPTSTVLITNVMSALGTDFVPRVGEHSSQFLCDGGVPHDRAISNYQKTLPSALVWVSWGKRRPSCVRGSQAR